MENGEVSKKIGKSAVIIFAGTVLGAALNYITRILIARFFNPSNYGLITIGLAILSAAATLSLLGLRNGISRWIGYFSGKRGKIKGIIFSSLKISLPLSIVVSSIIFLFSKEIAIFLGMESLSNMLRLLSLGIVPLVIIDILISSMRGLGNSKYKVYSYDIFWPASKALMVGIVCYFGLSILNVVQVHVIALLLTSVISFVFLWKNFPMNRIEMKNFSCKKLFSFSWPLTISSILFMVLAWTDTFMLGYFKNSVQVGIYNVALPTASSLLFVLFSFNYIFLPKASELYSNNEGEKLKKTYKEVTRWIFLITLPLFVLMLSFPDEIISVFFGREYIMGATSLFILSMGYFYSAIVGPTGNVLISIGKPKYFMSIFIIMVSINISFNLLLIPSMGFMGASYSLVVSFIVGWTFSIFLLYKQLKVYPFSKGQIKPILLSILLLVPFLLMLNFVSINFVFLIILFGCYTLSYFIFLYKYILKPKEIDMIKKLKNKLL